MTLEAILAASWNVFIVLVVEYCVVISVLGPKLSVTLCLVLHEIFLYHKEGTAMFKLARTLHQNEKKCYT